jgi:hypothetical protein
MADGDDFSDMFDLAADLTAAAETALPFIEKALEVTARSIKDDWKQGAEVSREDWNFADDYSASITYEKKHSPGEIGIEIGPELGRPGGSGGFLEEASGDVRSAPQHAGRDAVRANEDDFVEGLEIALFDATVKAVSE